MTSMGQQRWVVVTGASSGIGRDIALTLYQYDYRVIATARRDEDLEELRRLGLTTCALELADSASVDRAINTILSLCDNALYALINNAAYGQPGAVEDLSRDSLEQQFAVNLFGTHQLTVGLLPALKQGAEGRLVTISSVLGLVAFPWQGAYNASKFALEGLTDTLRLELYDSPVKVSLIEPGPIRSRFRQNALEAFQQDINWQDSDHANDYRRVTNYYAASDHPTPFTGSPALVTKRVLHALSSPRPQPRYYVTVPTYVLATCRRLLPWRWLDRLLVKLGAMR
ncbi:SDR family NAD(P)-dependent oxidoreductase [Desulfuromonas acetoxidans]|uniref:Short-chain dehydrogenase/reductase SDR n=1 Tax=Desulfuromonas acetoxidans (strain DSM 684 / 11070) TaxID=281689 RepID=Q1JYA3_DESA6|nr:SDR family NAD(P)-dependent oxidoreductase [Desulfuromonas acetoxidans]EAT15303.1 short-chain dehydrogenase/reductase SDR [Desulfuromonas acetoxidans DSM 684]MBF0645588.1 SDR family NAD(P)-dependent oxidoreductase [Desulfuromonas acetoxidans]NVD23390.1 SDR family NAD(P)-dependent oxidoreductase [Desulfuromonas acetoxidans]NVE15369.1 SDR family NAD(P)-dependent oxidoreductase [Desulfuromonas acetoxidans]